MILAGILLKPPLKSAKISGEIQVIFKGALTPNLVSLRIAKNICVLMESLK